MISRNNNSINSIEEVLESSENPASRPSKHVSQDSQDSQTSQSSQASQASQSLDSMKLSPLKNPLAKPNHLRRFSRSGLNLGITITDSDTSPMTSPLLRSASVHVSRVASPISDKMLSAQNSPVVNQQFWRQRASSVSGGASASASTASVASSSTLSGATAVPASSSGVPGNGNGNGNSNAAAVGSAASAASAAADDITDAMRTLALKEMRVVELRDEIKKLTQLLETEMTELSVLKQSVQKSLYKGLGSQSQAVASRPLSRAQPRSSHTSPVMHQPQPQHAAAPQQPILGQFGAADSGKPAAQSPSKRLSMWDSISKPLNLFSQFDNMIQSEFEKLAINSSSSTPFTSPSTNAKPAADFGKGDDDFMSWGEFDDESPTKMASSKPRRQSSLVLSPSGSSNGKLVKKGGAIKSPKSTDTFAKPTRTPSFRKSVNLNDHKIIIPKRAKQRSTENSGHGAVGAGGDQKQVNQPILDLVAKEPTEVLQSMSSSLWNFYEDVKDGLMLSIEEERALREDRAPYNKINGSFDDLIDLDSSPNK